MDSKTVINYKERHKILNTPVPLPAGLRSMFGKDPQERRGTWGPWHCFSVCDMLKGVTHVSVQASGGRLNI